MSWTIYQNIKQLYETRDIDAALVLIEKSRRDTEEIRSHISCIEADCHLALGNTIKAIEVLEHEIQSQSNNFWVYYAIANHYRNEGRYADAADAYRTAHFLQGWPESRKNRYLFTHDYFSANIPVWQRWFAKSITCEPIRCLEIGSWQGASAAWLLDNIVSKRPGSSLTCIDTFQGSSEHQLWINLLSATIQDLFDYNVDASGYRALCEKLVGKSQEILPTLSNRRYDFIYVDGAHEAKFVIQDAILSWQVLAPHGYLLFDDLDLQFPQRPHQNTNNAISSFVNWFSDDLIIVETNRQMLLQKK